MIFWIAAAAITAGVTWLVLLPSIRANSDAAPAARKRGFVAIALAIPLLALGAYAIGGQPYLPDRPYAKREAERVAAGLPSDQEKQLVEQLAAHMDKYPND